MAWVPVEFNPPPGHLLICVQHSPGCLDEIMKMSFDGVNYVWEPSGDVSSVVPTHWQMAPEPSPTRKDIR